MRLLRPILLLSSMIFSPIVLAQEPLSKAVTVVCKTAILNFAGTLAKKIC